MNLSLSYIKVLIDFLQSGSQGLDCVSDVSIVSGSQWDFDYFDLDGTLLHCSIIEESSYVGYGDVVYRSLQFGLLVTSRGIT